MPPRAPAIGSCCRRRCCRVTSRVASRSCLRRCCSSASASCASSCSTSWRTSRAGGVSCSASKRRSLCSLRKKLVEASRFEISRATSVLCAPDGLWPAACSSARISRQSTGFAWSTTTFSWERRSMHASGGSGICCCSGAASAAAFSGSNLWPGAIERSIASYCSSRASSPSTLRRMARLERSAFVTSLEKSVRQTTHLRPIRSSMWRRCAVSPAPTIRTTGIQQARWTVWPHLSVTTSAAASPPSTPRQTGQSGARSGGVGTVRAVSVSGSSAVAMAASFSGGRGSAVLERLASVAKAPSSLVSILSASVAVATSGSGSVLFSKVANSSLCMPTSSQIAGVSAIREASPDASVSGSRRAASTTATSCGIERNLARMSSGIAVGSGRRGTERASSRRCGAGTQKRAVLQITERPGQV
mmetsp:Transcript_40038/g.129620  ORF Transcript_40038/g.129620 Transcript_40038/m.129620 type:complete len:417 (-) Transcript_40038:2-1252(-)